MGGEEKIERERESERVSDMNEVSRKEKGV